MQKHTPSKVARSCKIPFIEDRGAMLFEHGSFWISKIMTEGFSFFQNDSKVNQSNTFVDPTLKLFERVVLRVYRLAFIFVIKMSNLT